MIWIEKEGRRELISVKKIHEWTGAPYLPTLEFGSLSLLRSVVKRGRELEKKGELTLQQVWLGKYFEEDLLAAKIPPVCLRWMDHKIGWGVFAEKKIPAMHYIGEYSGCVRKRTKQDYKNSYCFEYLIALGNASPYTVDARSAGGIARYINHSGKGNLEAALATTDGITHIILYTKKEIQPGEQLLYDYGPDYWQHRGQQAKL